MRQAKANNVKIMNLFMHSYSLLNHDDKFSNFTVNLKNRDTLKKILKICIQDFDIRFTTIQQFWDRYQDDPQQFFGSDFVPVFPF